MGRPVDSPIRTSPTPVDGGMIATLMRIADAGFSTDRWVLGGPARTPESALSAGMALDAELMPSLANGFRIAANQTALVFCDAEQLRTPGGATPRRRG